LKTFYEQRGSAVKKDKFIEKEELLRVIFMPINLKLKEETGSSLVELYEKEYLFVTYLTGRGHIRIKCNAKKFVIYDFEVELDDETMEYILLRLSLFLRRNNIGAMSMLRDKNTKILIDFMERKYSGIILESYGDNAYMELRVADFIMKLSRDKNS